MRSRQIARTWAYDDAGGEQWNWRVARVCDNLTRAYQRRYPGSWVTWDIGFGRDGNIVFYLWTRQTSA